MVRISVRQAMMVAALVALVVTVLVAIELGALAVWTHMEPDCSVGACLNRP